MNTPDNLVIEQLRLLRAENGKRDREVSLMKSDMTLFRAELAQANSHLRAIVEILGTHKDVLDEINERLLDLQRDRARPPAS